MGGFFKEYIWYIAFALFVVLAVEFVYWLPVTPKVCIENRVYFKLDKGSFTEYKLVNDGYCENK